MDSLNDIIKEYLIETGESGENKYARFYQLGIAYLREANINKNGYVKVVNLPINDNDTVDLPIDFIDYARIGIVGNDGQMHSLGLNDNLSLYTNYDDCGNRQSLSNVTAYNVSTEFYSPLNPYGANWKNGELVGRFFGTGGGNNVNGEYKIDYNSNLILIKRVNYSIVAVVLEYISDIDVIDGDFRVAPYLIEPLKAWLYWKSVQRNRNIGLGEKQLAEDAYYKADRWATRKFTARNYDEWAQAFRSGNYATTKW